MKVGAKLMTRDAGDLLDLDHSFSGDTIPMHNSRARDFQFVSDLGHEAARATNMGHGVHAHLLISNKQSCQARLLTDSEQRTGDNLPMDLGDRIRVARLKEGFSQTDLARAVGVSRGFVGQWENHSNKPGRETLERIAVATKVSTDFLLGRTDDPRPPDGLPNETAQLLDLWPKLSPRQRQSHLDLIRVSVSLRREMEAEIATERQQGGASRHPQSVQNAN